MQKMKNDISNGITPESLFGEIKAKITKQNEINDEEIEEIIFEVLKSKVTLIQNVIDKYRDNNCFPANAQVTSKSRGTILMSQLKVGDKILTSQCKNVLKFEDVFFLAHASGNQITNYTQIQTEMGKKIYISANHLMQVDCRNKLLPSCRVNVGDKIFVKLGNNIVLDTVVSKSTVSLKGAYCPYTNNGTIIVNDVLASCFTSSVRPCWMQTMLQPLRLIYASTPLHMYKTFFNKKTMEILSSSGRKLIKITERAETRFPYCV